MTVRAGGRVEYPKRYIQWLLLRAMPANLSYAAVRRAWEAAPRASTTNAFLLLLTHDADSGTHLRTIAPRSSRLECPGVSKRPLPTWTCGFDAWVRYKRFIYYVYHASDAAAAAGTPLPPLMLLAHLDEVADVPMRDPLSGLPVVKFGTYTSRCANSLPVPFPLKGFGADDFAARRRHRGLKQLRSQLPGWEERSRRAVWRGCSRRFPPDACVAGGRTWEDHPRGLLVSLSRRHPRLIDARFTAHDAHVTPSARQAFGELAPAMDFGRLAAYR